MFIPKEVSDVEWQEGDWLIRWNQMRGYERYYTLHKRRRLFWFSWWSGLIKWSDDPGRLKLYIARVEEFDRMLAND